MAHRTDIKDQTMERPSEEDVQATAERTRAALEKLVNTKIKAAQPKNVPNSQGQFSQDHGSEPVELKLTLTSFWLGDVSYMRYTPNTGDGTKQRIIKMVSLLRFGPLLESTNTWPQSTD